MPLFIMQDREESSSSQRKRSQLIPLAPRRAHPDTARDRQSTSASGSRPPRLSHRSRAGCWTCRARKVKCDEKHPKCGPCTRLNRECDWDHRWNFSDATRSTKDKYTNVTLNGNFVWDPDARSSRNNSPVLKHHDDLPEFSVLTTDEERERKAETERPGTFGVVVTPQSFSELPEYASFELPSSQSSSVPSHGSKLIRHHTAPIGRRLTRIQTDPHVVILDRFEDVPSASGGTLSIPSPPRRPSLPEGQHFLSIKTSLASNFSLPSTPASASVRADSHLIARFRHYIVRRLFQPQMEGVTPAVMSFGSTRDMLEVEGARFQPLHHAMCAVSALNLTYNGNSTLEEAMQHYHQALSVQTTPNSDDLVSDGNFFRHFLLFIYDICMAIPPDRGGAEMWKIHLNHLQRISTIRQERLGREPHAFLVWTICELDMYACLLGSGNCDFFRNVLQHNMLPPLDQQIPLLTHSQSGPYLVEEASIFPAVLALNQGVLIQTAKLAQLAQSFRTEAGERQTVSPGSYARWQARVSQVQSELSSFWVQTYPDFLAPENPRAAETLPDRVRYVFEHAFALFQAAMIYSRTSMFPGQRRIPVANQHDVNADTERRIQAIIKIATTQLEARNNDRRHIVFALFMAGFATSHPDVKSQALDVMKRYEGSGIGQNTYRVNALLMAVYEEQRQMANAGGRIEDVDWSRIAAERSLTVVNCGL